VSVIQTPVTRRLPIHPDHFDRIEADLRARIYVERGYGEHFGVSDARLSGLTAGVRSREELIAECDVILLIKPDACDLTDLRDEQVLWGWPHCVQDRALTEQAIERRQTLIAFEAMNLWREDGSFKLHVFHENNEMAGYCSVLHALQITGSTGMYGRRLRAAVIGFGATARGAVTALGAHGIHDVAIFTNRGVTEVPSPIHSADIVQFEHDVDPDGGSSTSFALTSDGRVPLAPLLAEHDIVVNCVLQTPTRR
jgi:alanine dehydrogenase